MTNVSVAESKRIVIKIGTSSLIGSDGEIKINVVTTLAKIMTNLTHQGRQVILVTSGAVGAGMKKLALKQRPIDIAELQALSAVGQGELMNTYSNIFGQFHQEIAQILLTRDVVDYPESHDNVLRSLMKLLEHQIIPIINENDAVSVDEFNHKTTFGENDQLAAIVTDLIDADLLIILSDIDGLYDDNPKANPNAKLIPWVDKVDQAVLETAGGHGSQYGSGGMVTKLKAADIILKHNKKMVILNGEDPKIIDRLLSGHQVGTVFSILKPTFQD